MPDPLTAEERAAIAAFRGRVKRCAPNVYGGDAMLPLAQQIRAQWSQATMWKRFKARMQRAETEAGAEDRALTASDAARLLEGADNA